MTKMVNFFGDVQQRGPKTQDSKPLQCARRLWKGLYQKGHAGVAGNLKKTWAPPFAALLCKHEQRQIFVVIDWFTKRVGCEGIPKYYNAIGFCGGFNIILDKMYQDKTIEVVGDAAKLLKTIGRLNWPMGLSKRLPLILQRSLDTYTPFYEQIPKVDAKLVDALAAFGINGKKEMPSLHRDMTKEEKQAAIKPLRAISLLRYLSQQYLSDPPSFIDGWTMRIFDNVKHIPAWKGTVDGLIFSVRGERFTNLAEQWTEMYCGEYERWGQLLSFFEGERP